MIRLGKGKKDRMIPVGERAIAWIDRYLEEVRPDLVVGRDPAHLATLFLTQTGEPFTPNRLTQLVRGYVEAARLGKSGSCHLFRHPMATLMLENGADIRYIQAMLGHEELSTTQIYTQVSIRRLKEIHTATHPGKPRSVRAIVPDAAEEPSEPSSAEALLAALEAEAQEEERDEVME
jgi:integrase/recombinase XerD